MEAGLSVEGGMIPPLEDIGEAMCAAGPELAGGAT